MTRRRVSVSREWEWSIGLYGGATPYDIAPLPGERNPILTAKDVTDVPADFVADPFMIRRNSDWSMFFEVFNSLTGRGEIGLATSQDCLHWNYRQIVLRESFHLSYPYVFQHGENVYMVPECYETQQVLLYRASAFPYDWKLCRALADGTFCDPSIVWHEGWWWLFVCSTPFEHHTLRLYFSDDL